MVTELLMEALVGALVALVSPLPVSDLDTTGWQEHAESIFTNIGQANGWLPIEELMWGLGVMLAARVAVMTYRIARSMWDALPLT